MTKPMTIFDKFWKRVEKTESCWNWKGNIASTGYGTFSLGRGAIPQKCLAHRFSYGLVFGGIEGKEIHHKCRNRACVNPLHLEAVDPLRHPDSITFLNTLKTHCIHGHELSPKNLLQGELKRGKRVCKECRRQLDAMLRPKIGHRLSGPALENKTRTHCIHGHEFSKENTYIRKNGSRACKKCIKLRVRLYLSRNRNKRV